MNMNKFMFVLLASLVLGACSSDDNNQVQLQPKPQSYPLTIEVTENSMIQDGEQSGNTTRAAITLGTTSAFETFYMDYVYGSSYSSSSITATRDSADKWTSINSWPVGGDTEVAWYASTYDNFQYNDGTPYINYEVEESAADQHDLLVATKSGTYNSTGGKLFLTFDHACSALRIFVKKSTNINNKTLRITRIVLKNVYKHGRYYYGTSSWNKDDIDTNTDYTLYSGTAIELGSASYKVLNYADKANYSALDDVASADKAYLFLIPQTLEAWNPSVALSNTYLELTCSINDGASQVAYIPFAATFEKGRKYDVKINIGKNSLYSGTGSKIIN